MDVHLIILGGIIFITISLILGLIIHPAKENFTSYVKSFIVGCIITVICAFLFGVAVMAYKSY